jgi:murein DD-endopeptidase MepM/ murein hydrolase activator NlpD
MTNELNFISPLKVYQTNQRIFSSQPIRHPKLDVIRPHYGDDLTAFKGQPVMLQKVES